jgi:hypothetical protein
MRGFVNRREGRRSLRMCNRSGICVVHRPTLEPREAAMVRTILLLIALLVLIAIGLIWAGVINLNRNANGSVSIETRDVSVGTAPANVQVPVVKMETRQVSVPNVAVTNGQGNGQ